jgi:ribonuclease T1
MKRKSTAISLLVLILLVLVAGWQWFSGNRPAEELSGPAATVAGGETAGVPDAALQRFSAEERGAIQATLALIESGGPFPHAKDGSVFSNRERRLPARAGGYYREYTVETPNSPDRGARRIVAGDGGEIYYTRDHYGSFVQLK